MNRIEMLKEIARKHTAKTQKIEPEETSKSESPKSVGQPNSSSVSASECPTGIIEANTAELPKSPESLENLTKRSEMTQAFAPSTPSLDAIKNDGSQAIGRHSMKNEKPLENLKPETAVAAPSAPPVELTLASMRTEMWGVLMEMRRGQIKPTLAREFSKGCNTIMKSIAMDLKAQSLFPGAPSEQNRPDRV